MKEKEWVLLALNSDGTYSIHSGPYSALSIAICAKSGAETDKPLIVFESVYG